MIELEPIETGPIDLSPYDWLLLTSIAGARELRRRAEGEPRRVAAIGKATAEAWGGKVDLVPAVSTQEGLVARADHPETRRRVEAERACVFAIGGGCLAPVAAHHDGEKLTALVAAEDGSWLERRSGDDPAELARELLQFAAG